MLVALALGPLAAGAAVVFAPSIAAAAATATTPAGQTATTPASAPGTTDVVRLPFPAFDGSLTPYSFAIGYPLVTLVYDTLLWRDPAGVPRPWLARSVTSSNGGRRLTVRLRNGVRWHDGRPLTAADVAFTFRFVATHYQPRFTPQVADVRRVRATGPLTVRIDLRRRSLGFDDQPLADMPILPRHLWRGLPAGRTAPSGRAIGSGPYRLVSAQRRRGYVLRANPRYFLGAPRVGEIRVPILGDADETYDALRARRVDMVPLSLPRDAAEQLGQTIGIAVRRGVSYNGTMLVLNLRRAPFQRLAARRVVAAAVDPGRVARQVAPAVAADEGFIHPSSRWAAGTTVGRFDAAAAREGRAALGDAPIRVLAPVNDPVRLEAGREVVRALRQSGARATVVTRTRPQLDRALGADGSRPDFDAAIETIPALVSQDPNDLRRMFSSDPRNAPLNASGYRSEAFEAAARRVASAADVPTRRRETLAELRLLARDVPAIPLFFSQGVYAYRAAIFDGWDFVKGTGILDKRSFLALADSPSADRQPSAAEAPTDSASGDGTSSGFSLVNLLSLTALMIVVLLAVAAVVLRGRERRRKRER